MINATEHALENGSPSPLRVGLVGVTGYGLAHLEGVRHLEGKKKAVLTSATVINPEQAVEQVSLLKRERIPVYREFEAMLDGGAMDWVCIPTGIGWHTPMTVECLRRGLDVLVEKPLAPTLQDVETIQNAEREFGRSVCVGFQYMYQDDVWEIKERLLNGEIGRIQRADVIGLWPRSRSYFARNEWAGKLHDGQFWILDSPLHNALAHVINLALFWTGTDLEESGQIESIEAEVYRAKPMESFDTIRSNAAMKGGAEISAIVSHSSINSYEPEIRIQGTHGTFHWRFTAHSVLQGPKGTRVIPCKELIPIRKHMFDNIADSLHGYDRKLCRTQHARESVKWVNAVHDMADIADIGERHVRKVVSDRGEIFDSVDRLEYFALRAFNENKSFRKVGAPWAVEPVSGDVRHYTAFEGRKVDASLPAIPEVVSFE